MSALFNPNSTSDPSLLRTEMTLSGKGQTSVLRSLQEEKEVREKLRAFFQSIGFSRLTIIGTEFAGGPNVKKEPFMQFVNAVPKWGIDRWRGQVHEAYDWNNERLTSYHMQKMYEKSRADRAPVVAKSAEAPAQADSPVVRLALQKWSNEDLDKLVRELEDEFPAGFTRAEFYFKLSKGKAVLDMNERRSLGHALGYLASSGFITSVGTDRWRGVILPSQHPAPAPFIAPDNKAAAPEVIATEVAPAPTVTPPVTSPNNLEDILRRRDALWKEYEDVNNSAVDKMKQVEKLQAEIAFVTERQSVLEKQIASLDKVETAWRELQSAMAAIETP